MKTRAGFTLVELLVVITIITILATTVAITLVREPDKARRSKAIAEISVFKMALTNYNLEQGRFPTQEQGLQALIQKPALSPVPEKYPAGGYLDRRQVPRDPWGHDYVYLSPGTQGEAYEVICYGSDGQPGGADMAEDISSANL